ncbi:zf-U1-domain-containing protein [Heliocybe sulcata]|uniref:U1 small nuclear ribonucleoprotein C n=1 Tax=Heliocybe sulcata TaxID=5364 RepID=A0A5C3NF25_9AGAM|nr:zf-U1-domain-containing protein [Heliocybe sulcata]
MPKHYCDYCDVFLTHDSASVRKAHNSGRNHLANVRDYYASLGHDKAQSIIDQITAAYETSGGPPPGGFGFGPQHLGPPAPFPGPPGFNGPPGGFGGPPGFGGRTLQITLVRLPMLSCSARPPFPPGPGFPPMGGPGAPPFPPSMPPGMGGGPPSFPPNGQGAPGGPPPFPPNFQSPPPGQGPPGGNFNAPPFNGSGQSQGPPSASNLPPGPGGIHPDRLRMMNGR